MRTALSFDDVLLVPNHSEVGSRANVSLRTVVGGLKLHIPILASNMPSVCEEDMAGAMGLMGGLGIVHRMQPIVEQARQVSHNVYYQVGGAIGISEAWKTRAESLMGAMVSIICIDVAHGDQGRVFDVALEFLDTYKDTPLLVGNFATSKAAYALLGQVQKQDLNRVALKVGVGGGSVCTTRIRTGCGVPTLQSVMDIYTMTSDFFPQVSIVSDGGCRNSGDIVKALAAGADAIMTGSLLAGTDEAPGDIIKDDKTGLKYKVYRGAASYGAKKDYFGEAEYVEGAERLTPYKGEVHKVLLSLVDGIKSGLTYCGVDNLSDLRERAEFVQITSAGFGESMPHGLF